MIELLWKIVYSAYVVFTVVLYGEKHYSRIRSPDINVTLTIELSLLVAVMCSVYWIGN